MSTENNFLIEEENVYSGALSCRGCGWSLMVRHISGVMGEDTVYVVPACCFSIIAGPYPMNELKGNVVHTVFAAAPATATGIRAALDRKGQQSANVVVLAGDGGTFDIGLQSLSGAAARGENMLYICNNNGAYMNTGIQTSTATPYGAVTTTDPDPGFREVWPKDLIGIVAAHNVPYVATASLAFLDDFHEKLRKAKEAKGFRLLMVDGPCPPGHKSDPAQSILITRMAVETNLFPLYEVENGAYRINYTPGDRVPVQNCLQLQGRFRHLFSNGHEDVVRKIQDRTDWNWRKLKMLEASGEALAFN